MRNVLRRQFSILTLAFMAMFLLPSLAFADSIVADGNTHEVRIGDAVVLVKIVGDKTYMAVKSGTLKLLSGKNEFATVPAGASFMLSGFKLPTPTADGKLQLGLPKMVKVGGKKIAKVKIALSRNSPTFRVQIKTKAGYASINLKPGKQLNTTDRDVKKYANKKGKHGSLNLKSLTKAIKRGFDRIPSTVRRDFIELSPTGS